MDKFKEFLKQEKSDYKIASNLDKDIVDDAVTREVMGLLSKVLKEYEKFREWNSLGEPPDEDGIDVELKIENVDKYIIVLSGWYSKESDTFYPYSRPLYANENMAGWRELGSI